MQQIVPPPTVNVPTTTPRTPRTPHGPTTLPNNTNTNNTTSNNSSNNGGGNVSSTPEDESPSLGGHQSEDDGYMSMNGRKARFNLSFKPVTEVTANQEAGEDFPPPPEEAERLIATLLPR